MPEGLTLRHTSLPEAKETGSSPSRFARPAVAPAPAGSTAWPFTAADVQVLQFAPGALVVRAGDRFDGIYFLRSGSCKVSVTTAGGDEHIAACRIAGELIGCEGIASGMHEASVHALESVETWRLAPARLEALVAHRPGVGAWLARALAAQATAGLRSMLLLGALTAEQRVASFLLDLAARCGHPGPPRTAIVVRMTRAEMGLHLGLSTETVSRAISRFSARGWIAVDGRCVQLAAPDMLRDLLAQSH